MIAHVSKWLLPVSRLPIREGAVVADQGRIIRVGPAAEVLQGFSGPVVDHGQGAILPGLVNCHVHLEFSALAGRIPPQARWQDWLEAALAAHGALSPGEIAAGIARGLQELWQSGTALAAEVTNTGISWPHLEKGPLDYHLFYECLGFDVRRVGELAEIFPFFSRPEVAAASRVSAAAHAPYSVSAALFRSISAWNERHSRPQMVHLGESQVEVDFLRRGDGFLKDLLTRRGRWVEGFRPPDASPADYLESLGFLGPRTLAVHGVHLTEADAALLARRGAWLVLCPRANRHTGAGTPPVRELIATGVPLALGTDSLAGNRDLNLFGEMLWLAENFADYPGDLWLRLGTMKGARALGRENDFGSLEPGKKATLGFVPLTDTSENFWGELYAAGAAGEFRWIG
jgi:aminodeoxyfutalosine deaminase